MFGKPQFSNARLGSLCLECMVLSILSLANHSADAAAPDVVWQTNAHSYVVGSLSFSKDGSLLVSAATQTDRSAWIWRTSDGTAQTEIPSTRISEEVLSAAFSPSSNAVVVFSAGENGSNSDTEFSRARLIQATDGTVLWDVISSCRSCGWLWNHAVFSPDGLQIAKTIYLDNRYVSVWWTDGPGFAGRYEIEDQQDTPVGIPFGWSYDASVFAALTEYDYCDPDDSDPFICGFYATLWNPLTFSFTRILEGHAGTTAYMAFSPTENILATAGGDGAIRFWNIPEGTTNREFIAHSNGVSFVSYAHDGKLLVSSDGEVMRFWRVSDGALLASYDQGITGTATFAVSPDGRYFALGGNYGKVTLARMPLWISDISFADGQAVIRWHGGSGHYQVQTASELNNWTDVGSPTTNTVSTNALTARSFFRVVSLPN